MASAATEGPVRNEFTICAGRPFRLRLRTTLRTLPWSVIPRVTPVHRSWTISRSYIAYAVR